SASLFDSREFEYDSSFSAIFDLCQRYYSPPHFINQSLSVLPPFAEQGQVQSLTPSHPFSPLVSDSHLIDVPLPHFVNPLEKNPVPYSFGVELGDERINKRYVTMV
ncbi:MAG: hypothetical protein LBC20_13095, partial [Planctomycetaceae bacterium]|nr:hypothetical protein [Planctomycetaceae bacterium]